MRDYSGILAFPRPYGTDEHDSPCNVNADSPGMELRDYFAAAALTGMLLDPDGVPLNKIGEWAYSYADAMMEARKK